VLKTPENCQKSPGGTTAKTPGGGDAFVLTVKTEGRGLDRVAWNRMSESEKGSPREQAIRNDKKDANEKWKANPNAV